LVDIQLEAVKEHSHSKKLSFFVLKEACSWQPGHVHVMTIHPTRNWQEGEKPATDFAPFAMSTKNIFYYLH